MFYNIKDSNIQGNFGLASAIMYFSSKGYYISVPLTDKQPYDLLVDIDGNIKKVQIKTTRALHSRGKYFSVQIRHNNGRINKTDGKRNIRPIDLNSFDLLYIITSTNDIYLIPSNEMTSVMSLTLSTKYDKYKILI